jgi:hypothetical protein
MPITNVQHASKIAGFIFLRFANIFLSSSHRQTSSTNNQITVAQIFYNSVVLPTCW